MKKPEEMTPQELFAELLRSQQKNAAAQRVTAAACIILALIVAAAAYIFVPRSINTLNNVNTTLVQVSEKLERVESTITQAEEMITQISSTTAELEKTIVQAQGSLTDIDEMVDNVNDLVKTNTDALTSTIQEIDQIDFDKLNTAITDLTAVIEPLSRLFRR